ncbi:MAG: carbonic anhydrase, partial [Anaerovoracaceae bacterium]
MIEGIIEYNKAFVENKEYEKYRTSKYPDKKLAILTCMDTRLLELLPAALGIKNGDAKIIKNAGGVIAHPFGSVVRSLIIAIMELGVNQIMIIGHTDCGIQGLDADNLVDRLEARGVDPREIELLKYCGIDFQKWLGGFDCV